MWMLIMHNHIEKITHIIVIVIVFSSYRVS